MAGGATSYKSGQLNSVAMFRSLKRLLQELQSHDRQFCCCSRKLLMFHSQLFKVSAPRIKIYKIYNPSFPPDLSIYKLLLYSNSSLA